MLLGNAVMINWSDVAPEHRSAYYEWHSREHMIGRVAIPGFKRGRRYIAAQASRDFLVCYEVEDVSVLTSKAYLDKANAPSALTQRTTSYVRNATRGLARVRCSFGIGTGGFALTLRFDPETGHEEALGRYLEDVSGMLAEDPEITGAHFCVADRDASSVATAERQGRPTAIPNWIVLLEGVSLDAVNAACDRKLAIEDLRRQGWAKKIERDTYQLQIMVMP
jgi:hypothetical protein